MTYHDNATCGSCQGPLEVERDAICETCCPFPYQPFLATEEKTMLDWKPGRVPRDATEGKYLIDLTRVDGRGEVAATYAGGELRATDGYKIKHDYIDRYAFLEPLPPPAVEESKEPELLPWPDMRRGVKDGLPWIAMRCVTNNEGYRWLVVSNPSRLFGWRTDEIMQINFPEYETIDPNELAAIIARLTRERNEFQSQRDQAEAKASRLEKVVRRVWSDVDCALMDMITTPSTPDGEMEQS